MTADEIGVETTDFDYLKCLALKYKILKKVNLYIIQPDL